MPFFGCLYFNALGVISLEASDEYSSHLWPACTLKYFTPPLSFNSGGFVLLIAYFPWNHRIIKVGRDLKDYQV